MKNWLCSAVFIMAAINTQVQAAESVRRWYLLGHVGTHVGFTKDVLHNYNERRYGFFQTRYDKDWNIWGLALGLNTHPRLLLEIDSSIGQTRSIAISDASGLTTSSGAVADLTLVLGYKMEPGKWGRFAVGMRAGGSKMDSISIADSHAGQRLGSVKREAIGPTLGGFIRQTGSFGKIFAGLETGVSWRRFDRIYNIEREGTFSTSTLLGGLDTNPNGSRATMEIYNLYLRLIMGI